MVIDILIILLVLVTFRLWFPALAAIVVIVGSLIAMLVAGILYVLAVIYGSISDNYQRKYRR
jgi:hypothetical protein